ncbi:MAG: exo-alpha-sialidase [Candidatus Hydrogenedentes bacterium]|nr:exo-alpha-sialidase [Candidatus Hydrogenedentota bacterium]
MSATTEGRAVVFLLAAAILPALPAHPADTSREETAMHSVDVTRELYIEHTVPGASRWVNAYYVGEGLEREEIHSFMAKSDTPEKPKRRRSADNGRTWSAFEELPDVVTQEQGARIYWDGAPRFVDAEHGLLVSIWLRQTKTSTYFNQCFSRISRDQGLTWGEPRQLRYEDGAFFDPANPLDPDFLHNNQVYFGNNIIRHSNGTLIHVGAAVNVPHESTTSKSYDSRVPADARSIGSVCFIGTWDAGAADYDWTAGAPVWVPLEVSSRGLMEPDVVELRDSRLLVVWRGSNTPDTEGRKWFSVSKDGGRTLSPVQEWKYDDGTRFYSPSSIHRFFRHSVTGRLYWLGNICSAPPSGNSPRYPLIIAEVDESVPALKRNTVTVIDDKGPGDSPQLQLSNFAVLENRESHEVEVYLTRLGSDPDDFWGADAYKYMLTFK